MLGRAFRRGCCRRRCVPAAVRGGDADRITRLALRREGLDRELGGGKRLLVVTVGAVRSALTQVMVTLATLALVTVPVLPVGVQVCAGEEGWVSTVTL